MDLESWSEFFVATAGAAAGLAGLIIVAMSVNIDVIVAAPAMPSRAGSTIANLVLVVVVAIAGLIPALDDVAFGVVTLVVAIAALVIATDSAIRIYRHRQGSPPGSAVLKAIVIVSPALLIIVGAVMLTASAGSGLYWIAAGVIAAFVASVLNAWVLLVELRR